RPPPRPAPCPYTTLFRSVGQQRVDLGPRPEIVRQDDAVEAARAAIGHAAVLGELGAPPQDHGHGPGLEEDGLLHLLAAPAEAFRSEEHTLNSSHQIISYA